MECGGGGREQVRDGRCAQLDQRPVTTFGSNCALHYTSSYFVGVLDLSGAHGFHWTNLALSSISLATPVIFEPFLYISSL
jgi:hypothetical protein